MKRWPIAVLLLIPLVITGCSGTQASSSSSASASQTHTEKILSKSQAAKLYESIISKSNDTSHTFYAAYWTGNLSKTQEAATSAAKGESKAAKELFQYSWPKAIVRDIKKTSQDMDKSAKLFKSISSASSMDHVSSILDSYQDNGGATRVRKYLGLPPAPSWYPIKLGTIGTPSDQYGIWEVPVTVTNQTSGVITDPALTFSFEDASGTVVDTGTWSANGASLQPGQSAIVKGYPDDNMGIVKATVTQYDFTNESGADGSDNYETADQVSIQLQQ